MSRYNSIEPLLNDIDQYEPLRKKARLKIPQSASSEANASPDSTAASSNRNRAALVVNWRSFL